jgi:TonB-linked SusC/RagA family outer membrane protein
MNKNCTKQTSFSMNTFWLKSGRLKALLLLVLLQMLGSVTYAQLIKVTGTVTDSKGEPLPGVSIKVKGTAIGVTTSSEGKYILNAPAATSVLVFSYIGYVKQEEVVGARKIISVKLKDDDSSLEEVVVTGFGQAMAKKDLTGATVGVGAKTIAERQPTTLAEALQGQAAGVLVTTDGGSPSGQGNIQIRGLSSINGGNGPLYVIDGITSENADFVNPMDIADIQILKDASSASVYGARGGNGVILITTKKGQDGKPNIALSYNNIFGKLAHKLHTLSADELRKYRSMRSGGSGASADSLNPYTNADNDFQDLLFRTSNRKVIALSASGGTKGSTYYTGINYTDDQAIILNSSLKRLQTKLNVESKLTSKLTFSNNLAFAYQTGNEIPVGTSAKQVFEKNPWTSIYRPDGSYAGYIESKRNPVAYAMLTQDVDNNYTVQYNTKADYAISKYLRLTGLFNAALDTKGNNFFSPSSLTSGGTGTATGSNTFSRKFYWEGQTYLNYQRTFNNDHTVTVNAGLTSDRTKNEGFTIGMMNYLTEAINTSTAGTIDLTKTRTSGDAFTSAAGFIRGNYSYKGRYILQANYRRDGSSKFGSLKKWGNFTSGSAAWRLSDEKFMTFSKSWLDDAKLRFSYGQMGNDRIDNYLYENNVVFGGYNYNGINSATENLTMGNPEIQWENVKTANYGADFTFLKGKISLTLDYYDKTTSDLLYKTEIPKETGKSNATINLGTIQNKGFEFTINATPFNNKDFSWNTSYNMSFQKGKVIKLANGVPFIAGNIFQIRQGGRIGDMFVYKNLGVYQYDSSNAYTPDGVRLTPDISTMTTDVNGVDRVTRYTLNGQEYTGEIKKRMYGVNAMRGGDTEWLDVNNDSVIDDADLVNIGNGIPDFYFGFANTFKYKRFSLNVLFNGQVGNKIYNSVANGQNTGSSTYSPPTYQMITNSWWNKGDVSLYPNILAKDDRGSIRNGYNSLYVEDGSFIRLSSARLTYALDPKWATKVKMRNASIFVYGTNLATWTKYSWYDPEFTSSALTPGVDGGKYPRRREVGFGVNINF